MQLSHLISSNFIGWICLQAHSYFNFTLFVNRALVGIWSKFEYN